MKEPVQSQETVVLSGRNTQHRDIVGCHPLYPAALLCFLALILLHSPRKIKSTLTYFFNFMVVYQKTGSFLSKGLRNKAPV